MAGDGSSEIERVDAAELCMVSWQQLSAGSWHERDAQVWPSGCSLPNVPYYRCTIRSTVPTRRTDPIRMSPTAGPTAVHRAMRPPCARAFDLLIRGITELDRCTLRGGEGAVSGSESPS